MTGSNIARWLSLFALMALIFFGLGEILTRALNLVDRANGFPRSLFTAADDPGLSYQMRPGLGRRGPTASSFLETPSLSAFACRKKKSSPA